MSRFSVARSEELPEGGAVRFRVAVEGRVVDAFAIRFRGVARAYLNVCTHRAVELDLGKGEFFHPDGQLLLCRAHGALYHPETGACAGGMCPRGTALAQVPVEEAEGVIWALAEPAPLRLL